jgi:GNAT superfamily N-acetyltransferase
MPRFEDLSRVRISEDLDFSEFDCGCPDLNEFIRTDALPYARDLLAATFVYLLDSKPVAFVCYSNDKIIRDQSHSKIWGRLSRKIPNSKRRSGYPAVKIGRLGVDKSYQGMRIGAGILDYSKGWFLDANKTGCRFITVDAYRKNDIYKFYEDQGFAVLVEPKRDDRTVLMYYDLKTIA